MILWLNGAFGVGKTATAGDVVDRSPEWRLFDPESVGYMLRANLVDVELDDFQQLPAWRSLVPKVAHAIQAHTGSGLVAVQSVLVEAYWQELRAGMADLDLNVLHVVLDCDEATLRTRIEGDQLERNAREWRTEHIAAWQDARSWMTASADLVLDTSDLTADETASKLLDSL